MDSTSRISPADLETMMITAARLTDSTYEKMKDEILAEAMPDSEAKEDSGGKTSMISIDLPSQGGVLRIIITTTGYRTRPKAGKGTGTIQHSAQALSKSDQADGKETPSQ